MRGGAVTRQTGGDHRGDRDHLIAAVEPPTSRFSDGVQAIAAVIVRVTPGHSRPTESDFA